MGIDELQAKIRKLKNPSIVALCPELSLLPPYLTQGAPKGDLRRFRQTWGAHPPERYYSPLFRPDGSMFIDLDRQEGTP